jgi:hypothetical protein
MTRPFFQFTLAQIRAHAEIASLDELRAAYGEVQLRGQRHRAKGHNTTAYERTLHHIRACADQALRLAKNNAPRDRIARKLAKSEKPAKPHSRRKVADAWTNAAQLYARA